MRMNRLKPSHSSLLPLGGHRFLKSNFGLEIARPLLALLLAANWSLDFGHRLAQLRFRVHHREFGLGLIEPSLAIGIIASANDFDGVTNEVGNSSSHCLISVVWG